jgi:hypothetical protein
MPELKRFDFSTILGWSVTRYDQFKVCERQYYYNYYGKYDPENDPGYIMELKRMTTIPLEVGNIVHDVIKTLLERLQKTTKPIDQVRFYEYARRKSDRYCNEKTFAEVFYKETESVDLDDIFKKVKECSDNLMISHRFQWLAREAVRNQADWLIEPPGYGETRIDGMKAYCKVDFLFPMGEELVIIDWKTGKPSREKHFRQLTGYTAWAAYHFDHDPARIVPITAHLFPEYEERQISVNEFEIQEFATRVRDETAEMYAKCIDVNENIPREKEAFQMTTHVNICKHCNFRELCGRI